MKLALECPTQLLGNIQPLADFDFILTHLVLRDSEYATFFRDSKRLKVLDNSTNELLSPCSLDEIERAAEIVEPDYIMPPDFLGDHFATVEVLDEAISRFGKDLIYPIVQGHESVYVMECFDYIRRLGFDKIAVPYDIAKKRDDTVESMAANRLRIVNEMIATEPVEVHLLGMLTFQELAQHNQSWVKSIDTGSPIMHGLRGVRFGRDRLLPKNRPTLELMPSFDQPNLEMCYYNVAYLRMFLGGV